MPLQGSSQTHSARLNKNNFIPHPSQAVGTGGNEAREPVSPPLLPAVEPARREGHSAYCSQPSTFHTPQLALILETKVRDKHPAQRGVCPLTGSSGLRHSRPQRHSPPFPYHQASAAPTVQQLSPSQPAKPHHLELYSCSRSPTVSPGDQRHFLRLPDPFL